MFSMTNNFDNEVEILKSRTLIKKVVNHLNLYISVAEERMFGYNTPLYLSLIHILFVVAPIKDMQPATGAVGKNMTSLLGKNYLCLLYTSLEIKLINIIVDYKLLI